MKHVYWCLCLSVYIFVIGVVVTVEIEGNTNQAIVTLCVLCLSECLYSQQHNWTQDSGCLLLCATRPMQVFWTTILLWTSERWDFAINSICIIMHTEIFLHYLLPSLFLSPTIIPSLYCSSISLIQVLLSILTHLVLLTLVPVALILYPQPHPHLVTHQPHNRLQWELLWC